MTKSRNTCSKSKATTTTLSTKLVKVQSLVYNLEFIRMAKYSRALTSNNEIMPSNLPFLIDYMEKNNQFDPDKEFLVSRKNTKKIS